MAYNPADILLAVLSIHPGLQANVDFELADHQDGRGPIISVWNRLDLMQPTKEEIEAVDTDALVSLGPVPQTISDRQFFQQLAAESIVSKEEALSAVRVGEIPPALQMLIDGMPAEQQFAATMIVSGATVYDRNHPLTAQIGAAYGWTDSQIDAFFRAASAL
ncbi:XkdW family protein [Bradyrhizobium sp. WU425]|uniref:XkdW family protein n=1 Tax=Bradyrhizobium sp. WU425 TaxID=187029 RepID=UPI001E635FDE|nr:XkdW family protein [Bradyrhizobium canariense]UFW75514.1 XkdW family protein [Bradyrhizobium canariense]